MKQESRRALDVEKLLQWAFREELPKQSIEGTWGYSVSPMFRLAALGVAIDNSGEACLPAALGAPHPDAIAIGDKVEQLGPDAIDWPSSRGNIIDDFLGLVSDNDVSLTALVIHLPGLVGMHARMGTRPRVSPSPQAEPIVGDNGKPVVKFIDDKGRLVEGRTKGRHYGSASRCPLRWFPTPRQVAFERLEYIAWHDALTRLADTINQSGLADHVALPPAAPARPWEALTIDGPRILPGLDLRLALDQHRNVQKRPRRKRPQGAF
jgi:hypothetical protein